MTNKELYAMLDKCGHRLSNLAKNSPGIEFELHKLINEHYQDSLRWKKLVELDLDYGKYHPSYDFCENSWFEYWYDFDLDKVIEEENADEGYN